MKKSVPFAGGEAFDRVFRALGDPHRIQILALLREKELSAGEILEAIDVVQSTLSHHMKTLSDSGVVNAVRRGKWTYYSLNESNLAHAAAFLEEYSKGTRVRKNPGEHDAARNRRLPKAGAAEPSGIGAAGSVLPENSSETAGEDTAPKRSSGTVRDDTAPKRSSGSKAGRDAGESSVTGQIKKSGKKKDKEKDKKTKKGKKGKK